MSFNELSASTKERAGGLLTAWSSPNIGLELIYGLGTRSSSKNQATNDTTQ